MPINSFLYPGASGPPSPYEVANSLRFENGSSDNLTRSRSSGNRRTFTFSAWLKVANPAYSSARIIMENYADSGNYFIFYINNNPNEFSFFDYSSSATQLQFNASQEIRDPSAWYHVVVAIDTTQSTESNRVKFYINGSQVTNFDTANYPSQNLQTNVNNGNNHMLGRWGSQNGYGFDGYMAEVVFIDGQALDPTSFGEFDSDSPTIWKPIDVSGLTFGTNGYYLDFENASSLGADVSGQGNNFTVNNLTSIDQSTDTCTNNFCTWNPLDNYIGGATFSEGNVKVQTATNKRTGPSTTIGMTSGKYYCEIKCTAQSAHSSGSPQDAMMIGIRSTDDTATTEELGHHQHDWAMYANGDGTNGQYRNNDGLTNYGVTFTTGDIIGVYVDLDNNKLYFAKNGTIMQSGTGISITDPASTPRGAYFFSAANWSSTTNATFEANFGGTQSFTVSSGNTDANGYGNFEYDPSSGTFDGASKNFYALNTKNLAEFG